eukprot:UN02375
MTKLVRAIRDFMGVVILMDRRTNLVRSCCCCCCCCFC